MSKPSVPSRAKCSFSLFCVGYVLRRLYIVLKNYAPRKYFLYIPTKMMYNETMQIVDVSVQYSTGMKKFPPEALFAQGRRSGSCFRL